MPHSQKTHTTAVEHHSKQKDPTMSGARSSSTGELRPHRARDRENRAEEGLRYLQLASSRWSSPRSHHTAGKTRSRSDRSRCPRRPPRTTRAPSQPMTAGGTVSDRQPTLRSRVARRLPLVNACRTRRRSRPLVRDERQITSWFAAGVRLLASAPPKSGRGRPKVQQRATFGPQG